MGRFQQHAIAIALTVTAGGCAGVPQLDIPRPVTVKHIIDQIECEIWYARKISRFEKNNWKAAIDLQLQVDDSMGLKPSLSFKHPLSVADTTFGFGLTAELKRARTRLYAEQLEIESKKVEEKSCHTARDFFTLTGDLGIVDTVNIAMLSLDKTDPADFAQEKAFGHTIKFVLTKGLSDVGPTWTLVHFTGPGGLGSAERIDTHTLAISFERLPPPVVTAQGRRVIVSPQPSRARQLNRDMLLQTLPALRQLR